MVRTGNHDLPYGVVVTVVQLSGDELCVTPLGKVQSVEVLEGERGRERGREEMKANFLP